MNLPLSHAFGPDEPTLLEVTIGEQFRRIVQRFPDRDFLVIRSQGIRLSYRQAWDLSTQLAQSLLQRGIQTGDRVGIWSPNRFEWIIVHRHARVRLIIRHASFHDLFRNESRRWWFAKRRKK